MLVEVARRIKDAARGYDIVARIGGEEFAWLLPGTPVTSVRGPAERMRQAIADEPFVGIGPLTISIGLSQLQPGENEAAMHAAADRALYAAKREGRNRAAISGDCPRD